MNPYTCSHCNRHEPFLLQLRCICGKIDLVCAGCLHQIADNLPRRSRGARRTGPRKPKKQPTLPNLVTPPASDVNGLDRSAE